MVINSDPRLAGILLAMIALIWPIGMGSLPAHAQPAGQPAQPPPKQRAPNIIIIFADDHGYADLGSFGARDYQTPQLDRMAAEGTRLTSFYVAQAVCSASRAALLTGCYPNRVGITGALDHRATHGLNPNEITIAEVLSRCSKVTGLSPLTPTSRDSPPGTPSERSGSLNVRGTSHSFFTSPTRCRMCRCSSRTSLRVRRGVVFTAT
jgi:hypothetical protein